jgi:predicted HTH domain antitoxin
METVTIQMEVSKDFLYAFDLTANKISRELKLLSAIELFREHKISMGKAAEFADMDKYIFQKELSAREIPIIDYDIEDVKAEADLLKKLGERKR